MTEDLNTKEVREVSSASTSVEDRRIDARRLPRKLTTSDKLLNPTGAIGAGTITQTMLANASVGQAQLKYELANLAFGSADTSKTASVTSGDIILGWYVSAISGAVAFSNLLLSVSGTTLTGVRENAPGGITTITYTVVLLKT